MDHLSKKKIKIIIIYIVLVFYAISPLVNKTLFPNQDKLRANQEANNFQLSSNVILLFIYILR